MREKGFIPSVSVIRVIAMLSIVFGHICTWQGINLYQLGGIGVEVFLLISGYLYGNKPINNVRHWLISRVDRILKPYWIVALFLSLYMAYTGLVSRAYTQMGESLLNLQGLNRIFLHADGVGSANIGGIQHCWFLTVIMVCYLLLCLLKGSKLEKRIDEQPGQTLLVALFLQLMFVYAGIQLSYILQFFIGYFWCRLEPKCGSDKKKLIFPVTVVTAAVCLIRIIANRYIDGTVLYDHVIARVSFIVLAIWICLVLDVACVHFSKQIGKCVKSKVWKRLDKLSFPIYLVHYMFMKAPFAIDGFVESPILQVGVALLLTIAAAIALNAADQTLGYILQRKQSGR